jgi:imidazolonepropionase-like amidohydrolase
VIVSAVYRLPQRRKDAYDAAYTLPERLRAAGVRFCISGMGAEQAWNVRNLPYHAATAVAYGLPQEEGVKAITVYPAEILGVADRVGSLAVGLHATLFIADGNILETPTKVTHAFIQGRRVDLDNKHEKLYRKYQHKP